jgi:hypothetical protein
LKNIQYSNDNLIDKFASKTVIREIFFKVARIYFVVVIRINIL